MKTFKIVCLMLLGAVVVMGLISAVVGIAGAVNHITFGEQITEWFGSIGQIKG